jgi:hypothetical protein
MAKLYDFRLSEYGCLWTYVVIGVSFGCGEGRKVDFNGWWWSIMDLYGHLRGHLRCAQALEYKPPASLVVCGLRWSIGVRCADVPIFCIDRIVLNTFDGC